MLELIRDICQGDSCGRLDLIVNKKYWLCDSCNYKRLHKGKSKQEVYKERHDKKEVKKKKEIKPVIEKHSLIAELKKTFSIKKISPKRAARHVEVKATYKKIDSTREPMCEGCGRGDVALSHSHLLSEYDRPDLYAEEENIRLHCYGSYNNCHETWERGLPFQVVKMLDFKENLEYIKEVDIKAHNKIIAAFEFDKIKI